jgi:hypothetical protein
MTRGYQMLLRALLLLGCVALAAAQQIATGVSHACFLGIRGNAVCVNSKYAPPQDTFAQLDSGFKFSCGLAMSGALRCWKTGDVDAGSAYLANVTAPGPFKQISVSPRVVCALTEQGEPRCWQQNCGALCAATSERFAAISCGLATCCGLRLNDSSVACFGAPIDFKGEGPFVSVSMRAAFACALRSTGAAECYGENRAAAPAFTPNVLSQVAAGADYTWYFNLPLQVVRDRVVFVI